MYLSGDLPEQYMQIKGFGEKYIYHSNDGDETVYHQKLNVITPITMYTIQQIRATTKC